MTADPEPPRLFVAGEALIDLVAEPDGRFRPIPGGSPANVAVGLSRLGGTASLLARLGTGAFGSTIRAHLEADGVDLAHAVTTSDPATLAVVTLDEHGRAAYDFYAEGTADWGWTADELPDPLPDGTLALVTGSIAAAREPGASALLELLRRERRRGEVSLVVDPNLRPSLLGPRDAVRARWDDLIGLADVVKVSDEDLEWLVPGAPPAEVAADWAGRGPSLVVVTYGADGALGVTSAGTSVRVRTPPVDVVDTVGAGDAFTAGLVDGLRLAGLLGRPGEDRLAGTGADGLRAVLDRAALVAAITCARAGADPPTAAQVSAAAH
ncbi:carbohydrate kinase family protein [Haloactinopolyspora alba]|uniref:carbohydrate kinase family protein n=1 Tax=Haloactinopolyspora alba TaxID=648780 RepID=UPI000D0DE1E8|nr:carbohydrate kinase [Haloactinopolyspora alba]